MSSVHRSDQRQLLRSLLDAVERMGNRLPDPAAIFLAGIVLTLVLSAVLAPVRFTETDPRTLKLDATGQVIASAPIAVKDLLTGEGLVSLLVRSVRTFTEFPPLGVVLVAMLGVGLAEQTGFLQAGIKLLLALTPKRLLTPMLILVALVSHSGGDTGFVLVVPLGGFVFAAAGRHPVAGIACAFAGVAGGFSASFLPSSLDPLLQAFTQSAAQIVRPGHTVNPLCNWYFMSAASGLVLLAAWFLTDRVIEPRLRGSLPPDAGVKETESPGAFTARERRGFLGGVAGFAALVLLVAGLCAPATSPFRAPDGSLTGAGAPLMEGIVPLIAVAFLVPGIVHGCLAGTVKNHKDIIRAMANSMNTMGHYLVMAFCAAQFTQVFRESNLGALLAIKGAAALRGLALPGGVTIVGIILLSATVNLLIGSASAKWALLGPILVPMMMQLGYAPEFTQAAYRVGDSSTNVVTPLMPYFPLILGFCQRYAKHTGVGTLLSTMVPYTVAFLGLWTLLLLAWWGLDLPLGLQSHYRM